MRLAAAALAIVMLAAPAWAEAPLALDGLRAPKSLGKRSTGWNKTRWGRVQHARPSRRETPTHGKSLARR